MSEATTTLYVQLLGKFAMYYGGSKVQVGKNQTTKALQLLQLLLYMGSDGISRAQLLENLFGRDADGDVANNLRVTVYNLRKMLVASGLPVEFSRDSQSSSNIAIAVQLLWLIVELPSLSFASPVTEIVLGLSFVELLIL